MPFDEAVLFAANNLFGNANLTASTSTRSAGAKLPLVIDPLVDGASGFQSVATETMETRITDLVQKKYPGFELQPFTTASLAKGPLLFIGTFTAVNMDGSNKPGRDWHRVCLALVDLRSGKIVSKGFARAAMDGVDLTPTAFFLDSPAWAPDPAVTGYIRTCQGTRAGDPINPAYYDRIMAAAMINDATLAYNKGYYEEALDVYKGVLRQPGGDQLRVYNGMYLAASKLGRKDEAAQAFNRIVDFGLTQNQLGVKFLFRPGLDAVPPRSANQRAVSILARAVVAARESAHVVSRDFRSYEPHRGGAVERAAVAGARAVHQAKTRWGVTAIGQAHECGGQGIEPEHLRVGHGRCEGRAGPAGGVQGDGVWGGVRVVDLRCRPHVGDSGLLPLPGMPPAQAVTRRFSPA